MTLSDYKREITAIFRRNTDRGFADWRRCAKMKRELTAFLRASEKELLAENWDNELFQLACRAFVKWGNTNIDDSNGETQCLVSDVRKIWDKIYARESPTCTHGMMLDWFFDNLDGSVEGYMEDCLRYYVRDHFKEPVLQDRKLAFLRRRIEELKARPDGKWHEEFLIGQFQLMTMQIYREQRRPIELIREYAKHLNGDDAQKLLAEIEMEYGDVDNGRALLEALLRKQLLSGIGGNETLAEYKALFSPEEWEAVRDSLFDSFEPDSYVALQLYASEGCLDRLMAGVEACGYHHFRYYAKLLEANYSDRCLRMLVNTAETDVAKARNRNDYRHIARLLRWMSKFPGGADNAASLARKFRAAYPLKSALLEELEVFCFFKGPRLIESATDQSVSHNL